MRADAAMYHRLGPIECTMIVKVDVVDECVLFEVAFESFENECVVVARGRVTGFLADRPLQRNQGIRPAV